MAKLLEIRVPETKPATEWVNGRALQKMGPRRAHSIAQAEFASALITWARAARAGTVGTEWDFAIRPPGEMRRPLVPDVAFLSYSRLPYEKQLVTQIPRIAPDVVVEVKSPGDRKADIDEKIRVYLAAGTSVVFFVDPKRETVTIH
ncbi:MAG: Uma2 family endonuclease, partial [Candidatus Eremiobacteraeota bacterium]|nr:Uma2 family endonuclease [Candidatus Eremiobacteraeota bacterium]